MKSVVLTKPNQFELQQIPIPKPLFGQVLIKVMAAPINPSDLGLIAARYPVPKKIPYSLGLQGCGRVVQSGGGNIADTLMGKKVAFMVSAQIGTYSQYTVLPALRTMTLDEEVPFDLGAMSVGNPITAFAFLDICKRRNDKSIVLTAAASAIGRMIQRLFIQQGINVISIVRRKEQVELLQKQQAAKYVLNSSDESFDKQLKQLCQKLNAKYCYDAIGGKMTGRILNAMPKKSEIVVYGGLSWEAIGGVQTNDLLVQGKKVSGFHLSKWIKSKGGPQAFYQIMQKVAKIIPKLLRSHISKQFTLDGLKQALQFYNNNMSAGKVIIRPWPNQ